MRFLNARRLGMTGVLVLLVAACGAEPTDAPSDRVGTSAEDLTASASVLTHRNNMSRSGAYLAETTLTPCNVNASTFGKLYERAVKGDIFAQPLYARGVATPSGTKNLVYTAVQKSGSTRP